jgi:DHA1 family multidrug resistance protein-like MFS transporter
VYSWRRNQIALVAAAFVGFTGFTLVMPFLALYMGELGVTDTGEIALWTGVTLGVTPAVSALVAPLWGRVGDRFGNKLLVQRSLLSCIVVMVLMAYATEAWHLFALRGLQGFVAGYGPLTLAMAAMSAPREQMTRAIGTVQTAQRVAPAIGPVIGGVLAAAVGLRGAFLVSAVVYGLAFVIVQCLYVEPGRTVKPGAAPERVTFTNILAFENFLLLMLAIFGIQVVDRSFGPVLLLHLNQIGYSSDQAALIVGVLFSVLALSGALGNQLAALALKRASARAVLATAMLVAAAALALFAWGESPTLLTATIGLFGAAVGTAMTTAYTAAGSVIPRHAHGASFGFLSGAALIGSAVSPVLSGLVAGTSIRVVFVSGVVGLAVLAMVVRRVMVERELEIESAPPVEEG